MPRKNTRHPSEASRPAPQLPVKPRSFASIWISLALFLATIFLYAPVRRFDFVNFDDPDYVTRNPHVRAGFTADGVKWALTSGEAANWFPVTRLSHMLDSQAFGLASGPQHLMNVLFHALASVLLFLFLSRATAARWPSAFVAALFALHPLHVESVAWISERKDVLSACFCFLTLWLYVLYAERPSLGRYLAVVASFCLGLMAKPMLVTLPFVMLLLDVWPLRRLQNRGVIREKIPLVALSTAVAAATYLVQHAAGAVKVSFPIGLRIENALLSFVAYIAQTFWPTRLAVFYPYPREIPAWEAIPAGLAIAGASMLAIRSLRTRPYIAVGWFWFLGTLVPVIGLVQVGAQARADRYMYIPMTGLAIVVAWGARDMANRFPRARWAIATLAAAACLLSAALTREQLEYWKNSETLFRHALDITGESYLAEHNLGSALLDDPGRLPEATSHLEAALKIDPDSVEAHTDLATALAKTPGRASEAIAEYRIALRLNPDSAISHNNLGSALFEAGRAQEAIAEYQAALRIDPGYADARRNLSIAAAPDRPAETHYTQGIALLKSGRIAAAIEQFQAALQIDPANAAAHNNLGFAYVNLPGPPDRAIAEFEAALRLDPNYADAHYNLGVALSQIPGRSREAIEHLEAAERIQPDPELEKAIGRLRAGR